MLDSRYNELKSGRVKPIDGEEAFARLMAKTEIQRRSESKEAISAKIERGLAQLDRGEDIPGDKLRTRLAADKAASLANHSEP
jgi:hypothetical protein